MNKYSKIAMVTFFGDLIDEEDGSAQKVLKALFFELNKRKKVICIGVSSSTDNKFKKTNINNVDFYSIPENKIKNRFFNKIMDLKVFAYDKMIKVLNDERPDIIHFHNRAELVDNVILKLDFNPKVVIHYHRKFKNLKIPNTANLLLGVSRDLSEYIYEKTQTKKTIKYLHNSVSYDVYSYNKIDYKMITKPKILFVGGLNQKKGFQHIYEFIKLYKGDFELHWCGDNNIDIDNKKVIIHGFLNKKELYMLMQQCDILLFPSYTEGLPMSVLESLYFGMYVITSRVGGIPEIFGKNYEYYFELETKEICIKVDNILNENPEHYQKLRDDILSKFNVVNIVNKLEKIYENLYV